MYEEYYQAMFGGESAAEAFKNLLAHAKDHAENPRYDSWAYLDDPHPPRPDQVDLAGFEIVSTKPVHPDVAKRIAGELVRENDARLEDTYLAIAVGDESCFAIERTETLAIFVAEDADMWGEKLIFEFEKAGKTVPGEIISRSRMPKHERHRSANPTVNAAGGVVKYVIREDELPLRFGGWKEKEYDTVQEAVDACVAHTQTPQKSFRGGQRTYTIVGIVETAENGKPLAIIETQTLGYESIFEVDVLTETTPTPTKGWIFIGPLYQWEGHQAVNEHGAVSE